jgi:hypothetical protein
MYLHQNTVFLETQIVHRTVHCLLNLLPVRSSLYKLIDILSQGQIGISFEGTLRTSGV